MASLLAFLTFLIVVIAALAVLAVLGGRGRQDVIRRLEAITRAERRGQGTRELRLLRDELLSDVPFLNRLLLRWEWPMRLRQFISQAGWKTKLTSLMLWSGVVAIGAYVVVAQFYDNPLIPLIAGLMAGSIPFAALAVVRSRRLRAFEKSFPEAIDLLGRAVRAGHAFTTGLEMIAQEMSEPLAGEFRIAFEEQNFGLPLKDALLNLTERVPLVDVRFFVTALLVQKETGGNLAEILDKLAHVVRERFRIMGEVRIKTAQGRLTAGILIVLPIIVILILRGLNPDYMRPLFQDPWGPYMLGGAALLQVIGSLIIWKIVQIEV